MAQSRSDAMPPDHRAVRSHVEAEAQGNDAPSPPRVPVIAQGS